MRRAALCFALALSACLRFHDLTGRACTADADCGTGLVCHLGTCAASGSFETVVVDLSSVSAEGGIDVTPGRLARSATQAGLAGFTTLAALPRAQGAAAGSYVLGGGTTDVTEVTHNGAVTPLPSARSGLAAAWAPGRLYALGGASSDGTLLADALSAPIFPDAGLGDWKPEPSLPSARRGLAAAAAGSFVYAVGGETAAGLSSDLLAAPILGNGALGAWRLAGHLPDARARSGAAVFNHRLYLAGGTCEGGACPPLRLSLFADGGLDTAEPLADPGARDSAAVAIAGGALHVMGGRLADGTVLDDVLSLPLTGSGAGDWLPQPSLPKPLWGAAALTLPGGLAVIGGAGLDGGAVGQQLNANASGAGIGPWGDGPDLPQVTEGAVAVVWNGAIYVIGGDPHQTVLDTIYRSEPAADGSLSAWTLAGHTPHPGADFGALAWGSRLYLVGGCSNIGVGNGDCLSISDVAVADFQADGGVGAFQVVAQLMTDTDGAAVTAVNGTLYAVGGVTGYNPTLPDVLKAHLDPMSNMLGSFAQNAALPANPGLWAHGLVASRGALYVVGGQTQGGFGGYSTRVLLGALAPDGTVSGWSVAAPMLPEERGYVKAVAFDESLYAVGGCNEVTSSYCGTMLSSVPVAALLEDGGIGPFAQTAGDLNRPRRAMATATLNGRVITAGGYDGNPHEWSDVGRLHGRGQLGPAQALAPVAGPVFAATADWIFALGATAQQAPLTGGLPGTWAASQAPSGTVTAAAAAQGTLYAAAGTTVSTASIGATGLGAWTAATPLPEAAIAMAGSAHTVYALAGSDVFYAEPGEWLTGPSLPAPVQALAVGRDQLFALGGPSGDIFVSAIAANDSLGEWRRADGLPGPRSGLGAAVADDMLYVAGGTGFTDVLAAPIHADGSLGPWATVGAGTPAQALLASPGWLLALGANPSARPLLTPPSTGTIALRVDFGRTVSQIEAVQLTATGPVFTEARVAIDDGPFGPWVALGAGNDVSFSGSARALWLRITLSEDASLTGVAVSTKL